MFVPAARRAELASAGRRASRGGTFGRVNRFRFLAVAVAAIALVVACSPDIVEEPFEPSSSHQDYAEALSRLDLEETAVGRAWLSASTQALAEPVVVDTPFSEVAFLDPRLPGALGYEFVAERGRAITISVSAELDRYFADLYRVDPEERADAGEDPDAADAQSAPDATPASIPPGLTLVASRPEDADRIRFEPRRDGRYVVRIQPELLRGGRFEVTIAATASLSFPVEGANPGSILSFYGDGRDGGVRKHEGVDIFAPRGTPLLAASDARVARVGQRDRGGNIVTLYDEERDLLLYYAHIEEQLVEQGSRVRRGDVIGTVGNTGNAITTPPHLHIGVYQGSWRSDVDPWDYFVDPPRTEPEQVRHAALVGRWVRLGAEAVASRRYVVSQPAPRWVNRNPLRARAGAGEAMGTGTSSDRSARRPAVVSEPPPATLPAGVPVRVTGASGGLVRVVSADGGHGYVDPRIVDQDFRRVSIDTPRELREPITGDAFTALAAGSEVAVVGRVGERTYVMLDDRRVGFFVGG